MSKKRHLAVSQLGMSVDELESRYFHLMTKGFLFWRFSVFFGSFQSFLFIPLYTNNFGKYYIRLAFIHFLGNERGIQGQKQNG